MASGPEHYREAERLLEAASRFRREPNGPGSEAVDFALPLPVVHGLVALANVHVGLAQAAAMIDGHGAPGQRQRWTPVLRQTGAEE